ncbi:hypothetical protein PFLUV_G00038490 [Perca fluviatilis]|uniref:Uncharacterized protein n=1 Tax=Perca fluviatilis TaxID=8168 RepID=A0A6A5EPA2_PERFL|nr:hypothetical protein PFLUV_G00038490 [Perca fluviatilis]
MRLGERTSVVFTARSSAVRSRRASPRLASHLPPPGPEPSLHLSISPPERPRGVEGKGEAAHTERGAKETGEVAPEREVTEMQC